METEYDYVIKTLLIGSANVGKSSIMNQFSEQKFTEDTLNTIGIDLKVKTIHFKNKRFRIQLWDTAGHERFNSITSSYYRGADCVLVVFALNHKQTFQDLLFWFGELEKYTSNILFYLIGNKSDLVDEKQIATREIETFITTYKIDNYIETSAKLNSNIDSLFKDVVNKYYLRQLDKKKETKIIPGITNLSTTKKLTKKCC